MPSLSIKEALAALKKQHKVAVTGVPSPRKNLPKTKMGRLADDLKQVRDLRLALSKLADAVKAEEQRIMDHLVDNVNLEVESGVVGTDYKVTITREDIPIVEDWEKLYAHILKKKDFSLLNKALSRAAVKEIWDAEESVPGVGKHGTKKISLTKV